MDFEKLRLALTIGLLIGVPLGSYVALVSHRHQPVKGGLGAHIFHAAASIILCTALPGVLVEVFSGAGFLNAVAFGFGAVILAFLTLCGYALFERPALAQQAAADAEDRGWTAEKAKSSGL
ncbi:MAG: hypothetical protein SF162_14995 [bacterium]|nr:hypothetical protein [bacterium]